MIPDRVWLSNIGSDNRRLIHNALAPLGWRIDECPMDRIAAHTTPDGGVEVLIIEAPPISGRPVATILPTLWLLPPAAVIPQVAGEGPHEFIRLPAPCEVIVARCLSLVRATLRERALRRYEREAVAQLERRRGMVERIAHQLASPLSAVIEYLELLSESEPGDLGDRQREMVREAKSAARRITERVEEIVDATATESAVAIEVSIGRTELRPILEEVLEWAVPKLRGTGHEMSVQLEPAVPSVCGDKERLCQALRHLIETAACLTPSGGRMEIAAARDPEWTGFARISVAVKPTHGTIPPLEGEAGQSETAEEGEPRETAPGNHGTEMAFVRAIGSALGGFVRVIQSTACGRRVDICLPVWESRAARIAEAQALLMTPGRIPGGYWVCRSAGARHASQQESGIQPWATLSPGEILRVGAEPIEGMIPVGRVRDLRDPGSLARALQPRLDIRSKEIAQEEGVSECRV